jgi:hypothetical protein
MTHAYLGLAALDAVMTSLGYALLVALGVVRSGMRALRFLGLAFLTGWSLLGVALSFALSVGLDAGPATVLVVAAVGIVACLVLRRRLPVLALASRRREGPVATVVALVGAALVVATGIAAVAESLRAVTDMSYDVWSFWLPKAEAIYYFHGLDTGLGGFTTYGNPEYPPLVPALDAASFHFMGGVYPWVLTLQQSVLFLAFVGSVAALSSRVPRWILFPLLALIALAPQVWSQLFSLMPDQTLAYLLAVAGVCGLLWLEDRRPPWLVLAIVFLAAAALTKDEGVLLGGLLALGLIAADVVRRRRAALPSAALLLAPLATLPWRAWLGVHEQPLTASNDSWLDLLHPVYAADRIDRLGYASRSMVELLADPSRWSPVLALALAVLVVLAPTLRELSLAVCAWVVVAFAGLASVYWISWSDVHWYVTTSAYRVLESLPIVVGAMLPLLFGIAIGRENAHSSPASSCSRHSPARSP